MGGAFAETSLVFPVGAQIACVLAPQRGVGGNKEIKFRAKVLRSGAEAERGKTVNLAAVQFMEVARNDLDALRELLQDLSGVIFSENFLVDALVNPVCDFYERRQVDIHEFSPLFI